MRPMKKTDKAFKRLRAAKENETDKIDCPVCAIRFESGIEQIESNCIDSLRNLRDICAKIEARRLAGVAIKEDMYDRMRDLVIEATCYLKQRDEGPARESRESCI
jgi:hypothetical protein